jgi:glycosyltransferase involved in cell wall biosynthesis
MKVLIIHQHLKTPETGGALRSYYLAKALVDAGIEVVFITGWNGKKYDKRNVDGIEGHYLPIAYDNAFGFASRSSSFIRFAFKSYSIAKKIKDVSVCYAISVPLTIGLPAIWLKKEKRIPFIFEVGDLWPDAPIQLGFITNPLFKAFLYRLEKWIYRKADSVVALSEPIRNSILKKVPGKKVHLIPNMADCEFYFPSEKQNESKFSTTGKFVVSYIGATGVANGLAYFLECARNSAKANLPIHFILAGDGAQLEHLKKSAHTLALSNITFTGLVNRDQVSEIMRMTDAIFVCYKNVPILETGSPNKYFDGLAAGKLIINNFGGWIKQEIEQNKCGINLDPKHPTDFVKKIESFLHERKLLAAYQTASRQLAEKKYSRSKLSQEFASIFLPYSQAR